MQTYRMLVRDLRSRRIGSMCVGGGRVLLEVQENATV